MLCSVHSFISKKIIYKSSRRNGKSFHLNHEMGNVPRITYSNSNVSSIALVVCFNFGLFHKNSRVIGVGVFLLRKT